MSRILILGGGVAGQTTGMHALNKLVSSHEVETTSPLPSVTVVNG